MQPSETLERSRHAQPQTVVVHLLGLLVISIFSGCVTPSVGRHDQQSADRKYRKELYGANSNAVNVEYGQTASTNQQLVARDGTPRLIGSSEETVVRGQSIGDDGTLAYDGVEDRSVEPAQYSPSAGGSYDSVGPITGPPSRGPVGGGDGSYLPPPASGYSSDYGAPAGGYPGPTLGLEPVANNRADVVVDVDETQTGRFQFGVGINSDAGATAQVVIDERNFDWRRFPRSWGDIMNGTAWRGGGQRLRIEAVPGNQLQRYMVNFTEPYLFDTTVSLNLSGFLYDRRFFDWDEQRLGGRIGLGYRLNPDLSISGAFRAEQVEITRPRVAGIPDLDEVVGENDLFSGRFVLTHDTRNSQFVPSEGQYLELSYEQVFGDFDYPRFGVDMRRYFLLTERIDGTGKHVLGTSIKAGFSGEGTPLFEHYFAGGYSTLRGFRFRHASPKVNDVTVGGEFSLLGSTEYIFPITADEMLRGVFFADYGTVEEDFEINQDDFRVALGFGLRISVPGLGFGAPIAVDFAVPVMREDTDRVQNFSFFMGVGR